MSAFFMLYRVWFQLAAVAAIVGAGWWSVHKYNESLREDGRQEMRLEYNAKLVAAQEDARQKEAIWRKQQEVSNANHAKRQVILSANLATADIANRSLLDDLANIRRGLPSDTPAAVAQRTITLSNVFGDCSTEVVRLAALGDRWANEAVRCVESWPKVGDQK